MLRAHIGTGALLLAVAALAWWATATRMAGMDAGPGTDLGAFAWFSGVWVVMMAAMMLPSLAPTAAVYVQAASRRLWRSSLLFTGGYLCTWAVAGAFAYCVFALGRSSFGSDLAWHAGGRWLAGCVLALAAVYELTPVKQMCLRMCLAPRKRRSGSVDALHAGASNAGWCVGCCWGLMAALFTLGVMNLVWMAIIAGVIAVQKTVPWRRATSRAAGALLMILAVAVVAVPHEVPGLVVPAGAHPAMSMTGAHPAMTMPVTKGPP